MRSASRKINFNPGPAAIPQTVLEQAATAVLDYDNSGLSILEIGHRSRAFDAILAESKQLVKELCGLDDDYEVLWLHGGGRLQFCMVPMNFLNDTETAAYIDSGAWSHEAIECARYYGNTTILSSSRQDNYKRLPEWPTHIPQDLAYVHVTTNNTIYGTQWQRIPPCNVPLIADMSSDIFCCYRDYKNYDLFYAVAQKNIGAAGVTLVVLKREMLKRIKRSIPPMLSYAEHVAKNSVLNTSPVFAIYTALLTLRWTKEKGIDEIEKENKEKAALLYAELERNSMFIPFVEKDSRSIMNVCFSAVDEVTQHAFARYSEERNITGIEGHRSAGAFRASLYNAVTLRDVKSLVGVMQEFEKQYQ